MNIQGGVSISKQNVMNYQHAKVVTQNSQVAGGSKAIGSKEEENQKTIYMGDISAKQKDGRLESLTNQLRNTMDQISELQGNQEITPEAKLEKQKALQAQMAEIQKQIAERQMELLEEKREKENEDLAQNTKQIEVVDEEEAKRIKASDTMDALVKAYSGQKKVEESHALKVKREGEISVAKADMKSSAASGGALKGHISRISNLEAGLRKMERTLSDNLELVDDTVNDYKEMIKEDMSTVKVDGEDAEEQGGTGTEKIDLNPSKEAADQESESTDAAPKEPASKE